ncbi:MULTISPECIES: galactose-1-phosphate uridylyltransferase [unclassified Amycolatopsis]|uniref:galactose-1-phosphate uridylyltransferase n=1 Tax=unclassified Amycolatopsis TaxID=2618356 RepID=UPI001C6A78F3|nr:galactose-1-phosphate uridylyltransferase [Amycolatopsis sp. DSM 110486]QYN20314.1 galactose-1-phosphate uridylyltransferase [Amycolatopsis sp. DSM 110486]
MTAKPWHGGELRRNAETHGWSILAPDRAARPHLPTRACCPFCPGPSEDTPAETWRLADGNGWRVRAVRNRFALSDRHEVVIESPRHDWDPATATVSEVADVLSAWQARHRALRVDTAQVAVFRNYGPAAGISLSHPHSQVAGLPVLSSATRRELEIAREHHASTGRCIANDELTAELTTGTRIVYADEHVVAFSPFAPAADCEVRFTLHEPHADFAVAPRASIDALARCLRAVLSAARAEFGDPAYNLVVRTAPSGFEDAPFLAWSLQLLPRLGIAAGLELVTGIPVVTVSPERAAARLRNRVAAAPA